MKKAITLLFSILVFISIIITIFHFLSKSSEKNHYKEIEEKVEEATNWYLSASKEIEIDKENMLSFSFLRSNGYLKKEEIMDTNNIKACDGYVVYKIEEKKVTCMNIYIKCKNYESDGYDSNTVESFSCNN